jgi:hypothetical protein
MRPIVKTRVLLLTVVLAFGSLAASHVLDDDDFLSDTSRYNPYPQHDRVTRLIVKKSGVEFCIYKGEWQPMKGDVCEREETVEDKMKQAAERSRRLRPEQRKARDERNEREALSKGRPSWNTAEIVSRF